MKLTNAQVKLFKKIAQVYYFGMFKQIGLAKNDEEEYKLKDILLEL